MLASKKLFPTMTADGSALEHGCTPYMTKVASEPKADLLLQITGQSCQIERVMVEKPDLDPQP